MAGKRKTIEQQIADKEAQLTRLRDQKRQLETGQKVILGGLLLSEAKEDAKIRTWLLRRATAKVTREADVKRLAPLLEELQNMGTIPSASSRASESTQEGCTKKT